MARFKRSRYAARAWIAFGFSGGLVILTAVAAPAASPTFPAGAHVLGKDMGDGFITLSDDGKRAIRSPSPRAYLSDLTTGKTARIPAGNPAVTPENAVITPDGRYAVYTSCNRSRVRCQITRYDLNTHRSTSVGGYVASYVIGAYVSRDGRFVVACPLSHCLDRLGRPIDMGLLDLKTRKYTRVINGLRKGDFFGVALSRDGRLLLLTEIRKGSVYLFSRDTHKMTLIGRDGAYHGYLRGALSGSGKVQIYSNMHGDFVVHSGSKHVTLPGGGAGTSPTLATSALTSDGDTLAFGCKKALYTRSISTGVYYLVAADFPSDVLPEAISGNGETIALGQPADGLDYAMVLSTKGATPVGTQVPADCSPRSQGAVG